MLFVGITFDHFTTDRCIRHPVSRIVHTQLKLDFEQASQRYIDIFLGDQAFLHPLLQFLIKITAFKVCTVQNGIGYGFFIPLFFIVSGTKIDPAAVAQSPLLLVLFIAMLLLVRGLPVFISLGIRKDARDTPPQERATVALYCTTALPLIVAVTNIAESAGAMSADTASLLVAAGGITVLLMPLLASLTFRTIDWREEAKERRRG